eukprot:7760621-Karenia_brevis.AAC.1
MCIRDRSSSSSSSYHPPELAGNDGVAGLVFFFCPSCPPSADGHRCRHLPGGKKVMPPSPPHACDGCDVLASLTRAGDLGIAAAST